MTHEPPLGINVILIMHIFIMSIRGLRGGIPGGKISFDMVLVTIRIKWWSIFQ